MKRILMIGGSPLPNSRAQALAGTLAETLTQQGFSVDRMEVADLPAEPLFRAQFDHPAVQEAARRVADAAGVVVISPVYKAAYTGALKVLLDLLPQYALTNKTVLPLMIGGSPAHLLAIDTALRPVLCSMGAYHVTQGVYFTDAQLTRTAEGSVTIDAAVRPRLDTAMAEFARSVAGIG